MKQPALTNSRFACFSAAGESVLTASPQRVMERMAQHSADVGVSVNRRLSQPLAGVQADNFAGMLTTLPPEYAAEFLSEPRSGFMERAMGEQIANEFGGGPKQVQPTPGVKASPLQRAHQKLGGLVPKRG